MPVELSIASSVDEVAYQCAECFGDTPYIGLPVLDIRTFLHDCARASWALKPS